MQCGSAEHELFHRAAVKFNFYQIIISHRRHFTSVPSPKALWRTLSPTENCGFSAALGFGADGGATGFLKPCCDGARKANSFCTCDFSEYP